uniref:Major facilitator superfamily (MFS) profile domain-containing protein n=1 Tax=Chenopodium quinoa TaxID=63459 RepID=A0A803MPN8_CHEQI
MEAIATVTAFHPPFSGLPSKPTSISTKLMYYSLHNSMRFRHFKPLKQFSVCASEKQQFQEATPNSTQIPDRKAEELSKGIYDRSKEIDLGWLPALPHVLAASMANFLFGYHIGAQAHSVNEVLLGRFLVGLGIGVNTVLVPIYISEVAPTKYRGSLGSLCQIGTCLGIIASLLIAIPAENDPHWWRILLYIASIPGFLLMIGMQFAVDSPRWLCKTGRLDDAKSILCNLWGPSEVDSAIEEFQLLFNGTEGDTNSKWLELFKEPNYKVALVGGFLFLLQQFAGINGVLYFSSLTFQDVGITSAALASLYVGLTNFAGALSALYLIDKQGRRRLLVGSYLGMAISMFLAAYAISLPDEDVSHNLSILGTLGYMYSFAIGAGPVTGIIIPELSGSRMRGKIMSFSFSVHWVCNFLVGLFFLELQRIFGVAPIYTSFGGVSLLSAMFCYTFIIETKGRSLEEIEMSLRSKLQGHDN